MASTISINLSPLKDGDQDGSVHFLQTSFWAQFKTMHGWSFSMYAVQITKDDETIQTQCIVLLRSIKFFTLCYIPMGLLLPENCSIKYTTLEYFKILSLFCNQLKSQLPKLTLCIRLDPPVALNSLSDKADFFHLLKTSRSPIITSSSNIQPPDTVLLNITQSTDDLLKNMKSKWRYNIRLAQKKGVTISKNTSDCIGTFYALYEQTAKRDAISIHSKQYYSSLFELSQKYDAYKVNVYIAEHEGDPIASIITLFTPSIAVYLYGASSNEKRNVMSTYFLQWKAICDAKEFGSKIYDFYGIPPTDDKNHPMHGLYRFKTGFGGQIEHRIGSVDYPISSLYVLYTFTERVRLFWFKKIRKLLARRPS